MFYHRIADPLAQGTVEIGVLAAPPPPPSKVGRCWGCWRPRPLCWSSTMLCGDRRLRWGISAKLRKTGQYFCTVLCGFVCSCATITAHLRRREGRQSLTYGSSILCLVIFVRGLDLQYSTFEYRIYCNRAPLSSHFLQYLPQSKANTAVCCIRQYSSYERPYYARPNSLSPLDRRGACVSCLVHLSIGQWLVLVDHFGLIGYYAIYD
jgi:hypothetical protein